MRDTEESFADLTKRIEVLKKKLERFEENYSGSNQFSSPEDFKGLDSYLSKFYGDRIKKSPVDYNKTQDKDGKSIIVPVSLDEASYFKSKIVFIFSEGFFKLINKDTVNLEIYKNVLGELVSRADLVEDAVNIVKIIHFLEKILFCLKKLSHDNANVSIIHQIFAIISFPKIKFIFSLEAILKLVSKDFNTFRYLAEARKISIKFETNLRDYKSIFKFIYAKQREIIDNLASIKEQKLRFMYIADNFTDFFALNIFHERIILKLIDKNSNEYRANFLKELPGQVTVLLKILRILPVCDEANINLYSLEENLKSLSQEGKFAEAKNIEMKISNLEKVFNFRDQIFKDLNFFTADVRVGEIIQTASAFNHMLIKFVILALADPDFKLGSFNLAVMDIVVKINELISRITNKIVKEKPGPLSVKAQGLIKIAIVAYSCNLSELNSKHQALLTAFEKYEKVDVLEEKFQPLGLGTSSVTGGPQEDEKMTSRPTSSSVPIQRPSPLHVIRPIDNCIQFLRRFSLLDRCSWSKESWDARREIRNQTIFKKRFPNNMSISSSKTMASSSDSKILINS